MKKLKNYFLFALTGLLLAACYPGGPSYVEDYDMVFSTHIDQHDFSDQAQNTYVMPDSIVDITDEDEDAEPINPNLEKEILNTINQNMLDFGYQKLPDADVANADYIVFAQRLIATNWVNYYWGGWGGYYPGWGYPGWGYPPYYSSYSYQTGTLYVTMIDVATSDTANEYVNFVWDAGVNGLLGTSSGATSQRVNEGVNQMFAQSEYLKKN